MSNVNHNLKKAKELLQKAGITSFALDAEVLLSHVIEKDRAFLLLNPDYPLPTQLELEFQKLIKRRSNHEPIAYIIGKKEFWGLDFIVNNHTLIPRPESETLIELTLKLFPSKTADIKILDIGTGTGCLAISLLTEFPNATAIAIDISNPALKVAQQNCINHNLSTRLELIQSNLFENIPNNSYFDLIISNPPYISPSTKLELNVANFEPHLALFAEDNGLYFYKEIAKTTSKHLKNNGIVIVEIGINQTDEVSRIFTNQGVSLIEIRKDLLGIDRAIALKKTQETPE